MRELERRHRAGASEHTHGRTGSAHVKEADSAVAARTEHGLVPDPAHHANACGQPVAVAQRLSPRGCVEDLEQLLEAACGHAPAVAGHVHALDDVLVRQSPHLEPRVKRP
eukprot:Amastigsp_a677050_48.p3 type:complete len:110 gc:universal Amastigsp_a677050_48:391-720(+)